MPRIALLIAYDGTRFAGWWRQKDERSVAGELDAAFRRIGEPEAAPVGASRTDAGVHARGQVAHVDLNRAWDPQLLVMALANHLPSDCVCRAAAPVADDWHAVHGALGKTYTYTIDHGQVADPFIAPFAWRPPYRVDAAALADLATLIPGKRDWSAFGRRGDHRDDHVRTIQDLRWHQDHHRLICTVRGDGFTYRLVRRLVGAMIATAHGGCTRDELVAALAGTPSNAGKQHAPALGLCLETVHYASEVAWANR